MTMLNIGLLDKTMAYITEHPEDHNQSAWRCGTTGCYAYWAGVLHGAEPVAPEPELPYWQNANYRSREHFLSVWNPSGDAERQSYAEGQADRMVENRNSEVYAPGFTDGEKREISSYAREILGLDEESADALFAGSNSRQDLRDMIEVLKEKGTLAGMNWAPDEDEDDDHLDSCDCEYCR